MKTVFILTAIERAFYSATIEYQLLAPLLKIASKRKEIRFIFLALIPITFYFIKGDIKRSFFLFRQRRKKIKNNLKQRNFSLFFIPVLFPLKHRSFYLRIFEVPLYILSNLPLLMLFQAVFRPSLIHARGYPANLLALIIKKLQGIRFLFDMRDVYTKKGIEGGIFCENDISFRLWHSLEKRMVFGADAIIVTSLPFKNYVLNILDTDKKIWIIPNSVNRKKFFPDEKIRTAVRKKLGIENRFVLIHSGTFSTKEDIRLAARYFKRWKTIKEESFFLLLIANRKNVKRLTEVFLKENLALLDYRIVNPEPEEVPNLLKAGDIGLHLESKSLATEYCIAIKDGEYLSTGLPVVCTPYLEGIGPLIKKYDCGIVTDPDKDINDVKEEYLLKNFERLRNNTEHIVEEVLSLEKAVMKLEKCYEKLLLSK
ncbi:MAG: hypothetical protein E3J87_10830 [Candidatus Cloacimonadota bacterium]|nr:MAG: hypothetical protein E3J87_10830 [Candidatus Cloacimonadota bacterium]